MQFTNPASLSGPLIVQTVLDPVQVAGGTVNGVTNNVNIDPGASIRTVTNSVPISGRDLFYWPSVTGEAFPPSFSSCNYGDLRNIPCVTQSLASGSATYPRMARVNQKTGKQNVTITFLYSATAAYPAGSTVPIFSWGNVALRSSAVAGKYEITDGSGVVKVTNLPQPSGNIWHAIELDINAAGDVTLKLDGAVVATVLALWPPTTIASVISPTFGGSAGSATIQSISQLEYTWS